MQPCNNNKNNINNTKKNIKRLVYCIKVHVIVIILLLIIITTKTTASSPFTTSYTLSPSEKSIFSRINWNGLNILEITNNNDYQQRTTKTRISNYIKRHSIVIKQDINLYHSMAWDDLHESMASIPTNNNNNNRNNNNNNQPYYHVHINNNNNNNMNPHHIFTNNNKNICHLYDLIIATTTNNNEINNHYYIQYISNYLRQGGRIIMNISLHMKKKQQQQQQQQLHYHHMTGFDEIDTYILNKSNQQLQIVEYINDKNGLSLSKIVSSTHILIAAIKRGYLIHKEYVFNTRCNKPNRIMFVTHPDDEIIFGWYGFLQIHPTCWHVISITGKNKPREIQFKHGMNILNITSYDVWGYKDCGTCIPFVLDINHESSTSSAFTNIFDHIRHAILQIRPINVVTHNPYGEYGHAQHVELSRLLTSIIQNDKLYYFNPSILKEIHDDQDDDDDDPFTILKQNIPTMRVIYPQEFGRTMAFDTTMSLPFIKAIDFINNINYIRHVLHIYCIDINTKWDVNEHVQNCYQKELIQDLILRDNIRVQSTIMKHQYTLNDLENINIYNHHQSIAGSPNPLYLNQHLNKLYDDIIQCMMNQYKIPLLSLLSRNTTMITTSTTTTNCKRYITLIDEFLERKEIENILTLQTFGKYTMYKGLYMKLMKYNYEYVLKHNNIEITQTCNNNNNNNNNNGGCDKYDNVPSIIHNKCLIPMVRNGQTFFHAFTFRIWFVLVPSSRNLNNDDDDDDNNKRNYYYKKYLHPNIELFISDKGNNLNDNNNNDQNTFSIQSHYKIENFYQYLGEKYLIHLCKIDMNTLMDKIQLHLQTLEFHYDDNALLLLPQLLSMDMMLDNHGHLYPLKYNIKTRKMDDEEEGNVMDEEEVKVGIRRNDDNDDDDDDKQMNYMMVPDTNVNQILYHDYFGMLFDGNYEMGDRSGSSNNVHNHLNGDRSNRFHHFQNV